jgi:UDP-glucose 4-epimerase
MESRRILLTGLSTYWGGRLAQQIEQWPDIEAIIGVDNREPRVELQRTEFVRVGNHHALLRRIVEAAQIDTIIDTRLVVDSSATAPRLAHENNVIGTMNILAACSGVDSPVRKFVFKSSAHYYGCEQDDPSFFTEKMTRPHPPQTPIEKDIVEAEGAVRDFASRSPHVSVTLLRFANGIGQGIRTSHLRYLDLPVVPTILGFDPRYQFIHEDDIVGCLEHVVRHDLPGVFNAAGDGVLVLSEVLDLLDKTWLPLLPPWGTSVAAGMLNRLGVRVPPEMLRQLRFGRGLDNRKLKSTGYAYRYTTREAVIRYRESQRVADIQRGSATPYRYEREVEEFLRRSPSVQLRGPQPQGGDWRPSPREIAELQRALVSLGAGSEGDHRDQVGGLSSYDELRADEVVAILPSLEPQDLEELRRHEADHRSRTTVLAAIDRALERARRPG